MSKHSLPEQTHERKSSDDHPGVPARIPGTNWVHAGAVARAIITRLEREMRIESQRCQQVRRLAERHIGGHYDPALSNLLVRLLTAEEALRQ